MAITFLLTRRWLNRSLRSNQRCPFATLDIYFTGRNRISDVLWALFSRTTGRWSGNDNCVSMPILVDNRGTIDWKLKIRPDKLNFMRKAVCKWINERKKKSRNSMFSDASICRSLNEINKSPQCLWLRSRKRLNEDRNVEEIRGKERTERRTEPIYLA